MRSSPRGSTIHDVIVNDLVQAGGRVSRNALLSPIPGRLPFSAAAVLREFKAMCAIGILVYSPMTGICRLALSAAEEQAISDAETATIP